LASIAKQKFDALLVGTDPFSTIQRDRLSSRWWQQIGFRRIARCAPQMMLSPLAARMVFKLMPGFRRLIP
jgi:hypothetical protein